MISWTTARLVDFSFTSEQTESGSSSFSITGGDVVISSGSTSTNTTATNTGSFSYSYAGGTTYEATATKTSYGSTSTSEAFGTSAGFSSNSILTGTEVSSSGQTTRFSVGIVTSTQTTASVGRSTTTTAERMAFVRTGTTTTVLSGTQTKTQPTINFVETVVQSYVTTSTSSIQTTEMTVTTATGSTVGNVFDTVYVAAPNEIIYSINSNAQPNFPITDYADYSTSFVLSALATQRNMMLVSTSDGISQTFTRNSSFSRSYRNPQTITQTISIFGRTFSNDEELETLNYNLPEESRTITRTAQSFVSTSNSGAMQTYQVIHSGNIDAYTTTTEDRLTATRTGLLGSVTFNYLPTFVTTTTSASAHPATFSTSSSTKATAQYGTNAGGNTTTNQSLTGFGSSLAVGEVSRSVFRRSGAQVENATGLIITADKSILVSKATIANGAEYRVIFPGSNTIHTLQSQSVVFTTTTQLGTTTAQTTDLAQVGVEGLSYITLRENLTGIAGGNAFPSQTIVCRANAGVYRTKNSESYGTMFLSGNDSVIEGDQPVTYFEPLRYIVYSGSRQVFAVPKHTTTYPS